MAVCYLETHKATERRWHQSDRKTELLKTNLGQNSLGAEKFCIWLLVKVLTAFKSQQSPM